MAVGFAAAGDSAEFGIGRCVRRRPYVLPQAATFMHGRLVGRIRLGSIPDGCCQDRRTDPYLGPAPSRAFCTAAGRERPLEGAVAPGRLPAVRYRADGLRKPVSARQ